MRNALALLLPVLASLAARPADACGPYGFTPRLMRVSTHFADGGTRAFVITHEQVADNQPWVLLAPRSYDNASVVDVANPETPIDVTLVGPAGTKIVSSRERVYLSRTFVSRAPSVAFEIRAQRGEFAIAMGGRHSDATWIKFVDERDATAADLAWVKARGVTADRAYVKKLDGTELEAVTVIPTSGEMVTFMRRGALVYGQFEGAVMGGIEATGDRFVVAAKYGETPKAIRI